MILRLLAPVLRSHLLLKEITTYSWPIETDIPEIYTENTAPLPNTFFLLSLNSPTSVAKSTIQQNLKLLKSIREVNNNASLTALIYFFFANKCSRMLDTYTYILKQVKMKIK